MIRLEVKFILANNIHVMIVKLYKCKTFRLGLKITTLFVDVTHKNSSLLVFSTPISIAASCMKTAQKKREVWISK